MPKIYELPASSTPENRSLVIEHTPTFRGAQQQQPGFADPRQMLAGQMDMELNNVTRWFDSQVSVLDQGQLEPDKYKMEYTKLQRQAMNQRIAIQAKHQATAQYFKNMQKLVEDGVLTPEQMQQSMLVEAGIPIEHVRRAFAQAEQIKPMTQLRNLAAVATKIQNFRDQFDDGRPGWYKGKLKYTDPTGKKRVASKEETEAYDASTLQLTEIDRAMQQLFKVLTPLEQTSMVGTQAVQRFGMRRVPLAAQRFAGVRITEPVPKKKEPTAAELRKQGTREAYEKGIKLGYWQ